MLSYFRVFGLALLLSACQSSAPPRITVDTQDGQSLPQAVITGGASQATISRSITVPSGGVGKIGFFAFTNPDCTNVGYATVRETDAPEHGSLEIRQSEDFGFWMEKNPRSQCNKKRVAGMLVQYKAKAGFTGVDHVTYEVFAPTTGMRRYSLTINVL
jgi:hypothetical protein